MITLEQSQTAAVRIAELVPAARFCWFKTHTAKNGKVSKIPMDAVGAGVGKIIADDKLIKGTEIGHRALSHAEFYGLYMQHPIEHDHGVLYVLDLDYKYSHRMIRRSPRKSQSSPTKRSKYSGTPPRRARA